MKRVGITFLVMLFPLGIALGFLWSAPSGAIYENQQVGFKMRAPSFDDQPASVSVLATFSGASSGSFAPNVNVQSQPKTEPAKYREITTAQFQQIGVKVTKDESCKVGGCDAQRYEYSGKVQGHELCFMSLAIFLEDRVLLLTATATPTQYAARKPAFEASFNSVELLAKN